MFCGEFLKRLFAVEFPRSRRHRRQAAPRDCTNLRRTKLMTKGKAVRAFVGVALAAAAIRVAAQGPQIGLIGPLPPAAPASTFDVTEKSIVDLLAAQRIGTVTSHDLVEK